MTYEDFLALLDRLRPNAVIQRPNPPKAYFDSLGNPERLALRRQLTGLINLQNGKPYDQN